MRMHADGDADLGVRLRDRERGNARGDVLAAGEDPGDAGVARAGEDRAEIVGEARIGEMRVRVERFGWLGRAG